MITMVDTDHTKKKDSRFRMVLKLELHKASYRTGQIPGLWKQVDLGEQVAPGAPAPLPPASPGDPSM